MSAAFAKMNNDLLLEVNALRAQRDALLAAAKDVLAVKDSGLKAPNGYHAWEQLRQAISDCEKA